MFSLRKRKETGRNSIESRENYGATRTRSVHSERTRESLSLAAHGRKPIKASISSRVL
jgi:hypothetical protein